MQLFHASALVHLGQPTPAVRAVQLLGDMDDDKYTHCGDDGVSKSIIPMALRVLAAELPAQQGSIHLFPNVCCSRCGVTRPTPCRADSPLEAVDELLRLQTRLTVSDPSADDPLRAALSPGDLLAWRVRIACACCRCLLQARHPVAAARLVADEISRASADAPATAEPVRALYAALGRCYLDVWFPRFTTVCSSSAVSLWCCFHFTHQVGNVKAAEASFAAGKPPADGVC